MLYLILFVILGAVFFIAANYLMIRKFYWGPSGQPTRYRSHEKAAGREPSDSTKD